MEFDWLKTEINTKISHHHCHQQNTNKCGSFVKIEKKGILVRQVYINKDTKTKRNGPAST